MKKLIPILLLAGTTFLAGCGDTEEFVFTNTGNVAVAPVAAPVARNDAYTVVQGQALAIDALQGVLVNDTLNANNAANVTVTFPPTTAQGGTVTLGANTGAFTYTPAAGFLGTDSFTYTLSNGFAQSSATVTINVTNAVAQQGAFVDAATGNDATGNVATGAPFATIQAAVTAAGQNADVVVRPGNYTGTVTLLNGQRLLGAGSALVNNQGAQRPILTGSVVLADGNTVDFIRFQGTSGVSINADDQNSGTVTNCEMANTTNFGSGVQARSVSGTWRIENNRMSSLSGLGVELTAAQGDVTTAFVNRNNISGNAFNALGFEGEGNGQLRVQANENVMTNNQDGFTFEVISLGTSIVTLQIRGNQNDDVYLFSRTGANSTINVENLNQLQTLNTGTVVVDLLPINDIQSAGF